MATEVDALKESLSIHFDSLVYHKIMHWVNKAGSEEVSGVGNIVRHGSKIHVIDAILLPQKNSAGGTDIEPEDLAKAEYLLKDSPGDMRFWWHSHVKMGVFWSHTDITTLELLGRHGWYVATVFNQHWERLSSVYFGNGIDLFIDKVPTSHSFQMPEVVASPWNAEFEKNVTVEKWKGPIEDNIERFREWRGRMTKRERKLVNHASYGDENRIVAIFETKSYGKVLWTAADERTWRKYLTPTAKPNTQVLTERKELFRDITEVRYASPIVAASLAYHGAQTWCENDVLVAFAERHQKQKGSHGILLPAERENTQTAKVLLTLADLEAQDRETEKEMRRMFPGWDTFSEQERDGYRDLWESGEFPWSNGDAVLIARGMD